MSVRFLVAVAFIASGAAVVNAQSVPGAAAKRAARRAVNAENSQLAAQTGQKIPPVKGSVQQSGKPTASAPASAKNSAAVEASATVAALDTTPVLMRETYSYSRDARRDPFVSLMSSPDLRPALNDLKLMGILYDPAGNSVAIMRDIGNNAQYRVSNGMTLGRMRVSRIKREVVVFTIEEFGFSRQDSLMLGDSTQVRPK